MVHGPQLSWFRDNLAFMYVHLYGEPMENVSLANGRPYCVSSVFPCPLLGFVGSCFPASWITPSLFGLFWRMCSDTKTGNGGLLPFPLLKPIPCDI